MKLVDEPSQKMVWMGEGESHACLYEQIHGKEDIDQSISVSRREKSWGEVGEKDKKKEQSPHNQPRHGWPI